ncbi:hypothetical protein [Mesorhizobium erdmanii]|uniref:Uncharacterized protein n=1 Tax=Mesorhizobium erdmanii TaxID=1777866 RepID=A0A6M7UI73_9HYPH|nr:MULTISPECIES: hypothetical protein [Mesorhizobium]OBQ73338.1 hypothetical protein A8146_24775 [Mesorhizobium loti]QKC76466.1 hypothetical protein EB233_13785 [Mesorhizobium erdmanii]
MPRYQIDEMQGDSLTASHIASGDTALDAVKKVTSGPISLRALQKHWFRVVDEAEGSVFEYSYDSDPEEH